MARPRNNFVDYLTYLGVRIVAMMFGIFPIDVNLRAARVMGWIWYYYLRAQYRSGICPTLELDLLGFRIAEVPEPTTMAILALGGVGLLVRRRRPGR